MPTDSGSWMWWFISVIGVGIAINLFSTFLYPRLARALALFSAARREKLEVQDQAFQREAQRLVDYPDRLHGLKLDLVKYYLQVLGALGLVVFAYVFSQQLLQLGFRGIGEVVVSLTELCFALYAMILTNTRLNRIGRLQRLIRKAEEKLAEKETKDTTSG